MLYYGIWNHKFFAQKHDSFQDNFHSISPLGRFGLVVEMCVCVCVCVCVYVYKCICPLPMPFFQALHWTSDLMISSRPCIGQPSFPYCNPSPPWILKFVDLIMFQLRNISCIFQITPLYKMPSGFFPSQLHFLQSPRFFQTLHDCSNTLRQNVFQSLTISCQLESLLLSLITLSYRRLDTQQTHTILKTKLYSELYTIHCTQP